MKLIATLVCLLAPFCLAEQPVDPAAIPESEYVIVHDGHLYAGGERQRYWAVSGFAASHKQPDRVLDRLEMLGFNAVRIEEGFYEPDESADAVDAFIAAAKKRGFRIWCSGTNRVGAVSPDDVNIINDPATADAWQKAIASMRLVDEEGNELAPVQLRNNVARAWDPRLEALGIARMSAIVTHLNPHTGLRWCDDPAFAVWELSSEEWWLRKMLAGTWLRQDAFFRDQLIAKWNAFLDAKYKTDAALAKAWGGAMEGESIKDASVALLPMAIRVDTKLAIATSATQTVKPSKPYVSRGDFSDQRASDVIEFLLQVQLSHKHREAAALKKLGRSIAVSPMLYDTGSGYDIQMQYLQQHADAVAYGTRVSGWGATLAELSKGVTAAPTEQQKMRVANDAIRRSRNSGLWVNWLLKPPGMSDGVPQLEQTRVEGKPFLCYDAAIQQPAKYRADFPLRLAALASIQDWDWVTLDTFVPPAELTGDTPFALPMDVTGHRQGAGYRFTFDPTLAASMRTASHLFRRFEIDPAKSPTTFVFGRSRLFDPASMDYAGSYGVRGHDMGYTAYQHGVRLRIDLSRDEDTVEGPVVSFADRMKHNPYTPTPQITFDWKKGYLRLDSPAAVAWTGLLGKHGDELTFANGITVSNVAIRNDEGLADPMSDDEKYIAFALASDDGRPLAETKRATLSLVSTSFNTGFKLLMMPQRLSTSGTGPVLHARVGATIGGKVLAGMSYRLVDFNGREIGKGQVVENAIKVPNDQPVWIIELTRD